MIVMMKKVSLVVMDREREISLEKLREAGIMHPEKKNVSSELLGKLLEKRARITKASGLLRRYTVKKGAKMPVVPNAPSDAELAAHILTLNAERKTLHDQLAALSRETRRVESWGDFDPNDLTFLKERGVNLIPYELPLRAYNAIGPDIKLIVVSSGEKKKIKVLAYGSEIPGQTPFVFPGLSISEIKNQMAGIQKRADEIETEFAAMAYRKSVIEAENTGLLQEIEFETARLGMDTLKDAPAESTVSWISGYVPYDNLGLLKRTAAEQGWALIWDDPKTGDRPPTLVRNKPAIRIIQPLFNFMGIVPGYWEYDISFSFLLFFSMFFAMIFGDAAYGLIIMVIGIALGLFLKKKEGKFPDVAKLFMLLSFTTIFWGSITGSWFAIPREQLPVFLTSLIIPPFDNSGPVVEFPVFLQKFFNLPAEVPMDVYKTRWNIQFLCFSIGVIQLSWARGKNIKKLLPSLKAIAQAGWLILMIGLYFVVLFFILKVPLPMFAIYLVGIGFSLFFIFAYQDGGNFFKNIWKSCTNAISNALGVTGSFADIISYIRLFAVGLAGSSIAESFNGIALSTLGTGNAGIGFVIRLCVAVGILVSAHMLNLGLCCLSVLVHGVRLNLLEYAGNHLGMEWSGYTYKPFAIMQKNEGEK